MWSAFPFCASDSGLLKDLLLWLKQLDDHLPHGALLVANADIGWGEASDMVALASKVFRRTEIISLDQSVNGWPKGANALFSLTANHFEQRHIGPWFWCEPDCIPLKKGWIDQLEAAYHAGNKPFMGAVMQAKEPDMPREYLAGCAVYPMDAWKRLSAAWREDVAFDVATAPVTVSQASNTPLIQHFWGQKNLPPTFVSDKRPDSPANALTLQNINVGSVLFHRNKDGTLLTLLGHKTATQYVSELLDVVLSFCSSDAALMLKNAHWLASIDDIKNASAVLLSDNAVPIKTIDQIAKACGRAFTDVVVHRYHAKGMSGWPRGPNRAFQEASSFMLNRALCNPLVSPGWIWLEPDAVPVKSDWLEQISAEYIKHMKPFMGAIIDHMGHMNGVGVYPHNVQDYAPSLGKCSIAWDVCIGREIAPFRQRGNHLIQHHISPPSFASQGDVDAGIESSVVLFHPCKTGQLIDRLCERRIK